MTSKDIEYPAVFRINEDDTTVSLISFHGENDE